jgi:hypothetical protein
MRQTCLFGGLPPAARVLVACEYTGVVRRAFAARGHRAVSVDLRPDLLGEQEHHIQGDALQVLRSQQWDLLIAFPPCTYLTFAGARWMHAGGKVCPDRYAKMLAAREFFMALWQAPVPRVAVENPTPLRICKLPPRTQTIQPYEHGHPYTKRTHLWLRGLPLLRPSKLVQPVGSWCPSNTGARLRGSKNKQAGHSKQNTRDQTFAGVAAAMAQQWG